MEFKYTDEYIEKCIDVVAEVIKGKDFLDYCEYENAVGDAIDKHAPGLNRWLSSIGSGVASAYAAIRNDVRRLSECTIQGQKLK